MAAAKRYKGMKLFRKLPKQFTRKGMTFIRSHYTLNGAIKNGLQYRTVGILPADAKKRDKPRVYIFILKHKKRVKKLA